MAQNNEPWHKKTASAFALCTKKLMKLTQVSISSTFNARLLRQYFCAKKIAKPKPN